MAASLPISVVVPAYNGSRFIAAAINSVHAQTALPQEIIVVDDGSADDTGGIATACGATVVRQKNGGTQSARNTGIAAAACEWIAFLDQDDLWLPERLEQQWEVFALCPGAQIGFTDFSIFNESGTTVESFFLDNKKGERFRNVERNRVCPSGVRCSYGSLIKEYVPGHFILPSTLVTRRDLLLRVGMFDAAIPHWGDYELTLRLLGATREDVAVVDRPVMRYRVHPESMSHQADALMQSFKDQLGMAQRVFARPTLYPEGTAAFFKTSLPKILRGAGWMSMRLGNREAAVRYLKRSIQERLDPATFGLLCCAATLKAGGEPLDALVRAALRFRYRSRSRA